MTEENKVGSIPGFTQEEQPEQEEKEKPEEEGSEEDVQTEVEPEEQPEEEPLTVEVAGRKLTPDQLANEYSSLQADYTKKAQRLAEIERSKLGGDHPKEDLVVAEKIDIEPETEKILDAWAKQKGYVPESKLKETNYKSEQKYQVDQFMDKHPEYKPENDTGDIKWSKLAGEINTYYRMPTDPRQISNLLERVHNHLNPATEKDVEKKALAKIQKNKTAALGGSGSGAAKAESKSGKAKLSKEVINHMKRGGYSDEDIAELTN